MSLLATLKFVAGAVARKDHVAALTHYKIKDGRVTGSNGSMAISAPITLDLDCMPKAVPFFKAIQTCKDTISMHMTPGGKLSVKSGKFKALIESYPEDFPDQFAPEGVEIKLVAPLIPALKILDKFIAEDASRPWARGILLRGKSAFATNNIAIAEYWLGEAVPFDLNIPQAAVTELIRIGEEPSLIQVTDRAATFHFSGDRWIKTQLYSTEWPDIGRVLNAKSSMMPWPAELTEALESLKEFTGQLDQVYMEPGVIRTHQSDEEGATAEIPFFQGQASFNRTQLALVGSVAEAIDLNLYPKPCLFKGGKLRGAIIGMRI
jgi:DNA polymerase III sliding clamp (beta) subunit (PCNA family)